MMNGTESTAKNDADIEVYLKEKVTTKFTSIICIHFKYWVNIFVSF